MKTKEFLNSLGLEFTGYPEYVSVSQIGKWLKCPLSYLFNYASDAQAVFPERMLIGSAVHAALETASRLKQAGSTIDDSVMEVLYESSDGCIDQAETMSYPDLNAVALKPQVRRVVKGCRDIINDLPTAVQIEYKIENVTLADVPLVGYLDLFTEDGTVTDFKVGARHKTEAQAQVDLQLAIYAYAMDTRKVAFGSISSTTGGYKIIRAEHEKSDIERFISYAEWVTSSMTTAKLLDDTACFHPNPNGFYCGDGCSHCMYCPFSSLKNQ